MTVTTRLTRPAAAGLTSAVRWRDLPAGLCAAGVLLSAAVHLLLYQQGYSDIAVIGPLFLLNAAGGLLIGLALVVWRHPIPAVLGAGFGLATLIAYYVSATVGLFGVHEIWGGTAVITAEIAEWVALLGGGAALAVTLRRPRPAGEG